MECGATFLHASSLIEAEKATILMGWRGTGKTNAILENIDSKTIWSDDLSILDEEGFIFPYKKPIRLYSYNIPLLKNEYIKKNNLRIRNLFTPKWNQCTTWA